MRVSIARMYGSNSEWAIMVDEDVEFDKERGFHAVEELDE